MKKDSSEQYLKYLSALALTVAAPATAAQPEAAPVSSTEDSQVQASQNLQTLTASMQAAETGYSVPPSWPESTSSPCSTAPTSKNGARSAINGPPC